MNPSLERRFAAASSRFWRAALLVAMLMLAAGLCPTLGFAETEKGSVEVACVDTDGNSLASVTRTGTVGTSYSTIGSDGVSLVGEVEETIASLEAEPDCYTLVDNGFPSDGVYEANGGQPMKYTITFRAPAPLPVANVTVGFVDETGKQLAYVTGSATAGTSFADKGASGKSLADRYNETLKDCQAKGYKLISGGFNPKGVYPESDAVYIVKMSKPAPARMGRVNVTIVGPNGRVLGTANGTNTEGKSYKDKPESGNSLWVTVNNSVNDLQRRGFEVKSWGGFAEGGTYTSGTKSFTILMVAYTGWRDIGGKSYWFEKGVKQGTQGRGKEIFDGKAWYWLDAVQGGAKTVNKDVFIPYFYSNDSMNAGNQRGNGAFGKWVHYDANGQMLKGWKKVGGKQYYFDPMTGEMAHGKCFLPSGGKRVSTFDAATGVFRGSNNDLKWEYWYEGGAKQGIQGRGKEIYDPYSKAWYWLDSLYNGKKAVNKEVLIPYTFQGRDNTQKWVRYDADGHMIKGWFAGKYYYDLTTGAMFKGTHRIGDENCVFDKTTGVLISKSKVDGTANRATYYVANKKTKIFHRSTCASATGIGAANRLVFSNKGAALGAKYRPCKTCKP